MKRILYILPFILISWTNSTAQTQDDFLKKYTDVFMNQADSAKARELAMEAWDMIETTEELQTMANYYTLMAIFTSAVPDTEMAEACQKKANAKLEFNTNPDIQKPATYDTPDMEWLYEYQMELYKVKDLSFGRKALKFLEEHSQLKNYTNYSAVASFFENKGDFDKASELYQKAIDNIDYENNEFVGVYSQVIFYLKSGQFERVEELIQLNETLLASANEYTKTAYESARDQIEMYYYHQVGDYFNYIKSAGKYFDKQIATMNQNTQMNMDVYSLVFTQTKHSNQAGGYESIRDWENAEKSWRLAEEKSKEYQTKIREIYPNMPNYYYPILSQFQAKRGNYSGTTQAIKEMDSYYDNFKGSDYAAMNSPEMLHGKAQQYAFYKDPRYESLFDEFFRKNGNAKNFTFATLPLSGLAYFTMRDGKYKSSIDTYNQLFKENLDWINDIIFTFGEKAFVAYYNSKLSEGYSNFHSFVKLAHDKNVLPLEQMTPQVYNNLLLTKSIAFKGVRKRKKAFLNSSSPQVIELYNEWITKKQDLIRLYQMSQTDQQDIANALGSEVKPEDEKAKFEVDKTELERLQKEVENLENRLASEAKDFKSTLKLSSPDWKSVRSKLQEGEAAIEIARFHWKDQVFHSDTSYYAAYIVKHDSKFPEVVYLPSTADLLDTRFYRVYKNSIRLKIEDKTSYKQYWEPIKQKLDGVNKVYFSSDGIYHMINLPTLLNPETGKYLLDEIKISNVTSTAEIGSSIQKDKFGQAVLIGRPSYSTKGLQDAGGLSNRSFKNFRNANVTDLPGTEDEVRSIKKQLESQGTKVTQYIGVDATEDVIYNLNSPGILHIATHGFWSQTDNATSAYRMFNAMVNSGLLMAGVVDYYSADQLKETNDGILTAYEAQGLEMENTELVVLSACETGLGDFDAGEGVYGLQRAFRAAGAKSIMTSLWKVDDQGTKDFMIAFYRYLLQSGDKTDAFYRAQQELKIKYGDPYYWGAFVLIGD